MEGPSLVIACEEFSEFLEQKVAQAEGAAKLPFKQIKNTKFVGVRSWGKNFLLIFEKAQLRIHFLMFGSYRIGNPREDREPKLKLTFGKGKTKKEIFFYSCAIKPIEGNIDELYDWSVDIMSNQWNPKQALQKIRSQPEAMVCDLLMDQDIFAGLGNIIKNEVLFNRRLHPEEQIGHLPAPEQRALVKEARDYSLNFYTWKKQNQLKKHWQIFRKRECPECGRKVTKAPTGVGQRLSHFCENDQSLRSS